MSSRVVSSPRPLARPHMVLLPGRRVWITAHCGRPRMCAMCLWKIAEFLAGELDYDLRLALDRPLGSYQAELGPGTAEQACELRRMVCRVCLGEMAARVPVEEMVVGDEARLVASGELQVASGGGAA